MSYLQRLSTQIYKAQYGDAFKGHQYGPWCRRNHLELNFAIIATTFGSWATVIHFHVNTTYYIWNVQSAGLFPNKTALSWLSAWCHIRRRTQIFIMLCFRNEGHYRAGNLQKKKIIFLVYLTPSDNKNLVSLVNFDFRILWCNMKSKNISVLEVLNGTFEMLRDGKIKPGQGI